MNCSSKALYLGPAFTCAPSAVQAAPVSHTALTLYKAANGSIEPSHSCKHITTTQKIPREEAYP